MANLSKTTKRCNKCLTAKIFSEFEIDEKGNMSNWCKDCLDAFDTTRKKSGIHYSAIVNLKYENAATMTKDFLLNRIDYLREQVENGSCSLTEKTLKLNETIYGYLYN